MSKVEVRYVELAKDKGRCYRCMSALERRILKPLFPLLLLVLYTFFGAFLFHVIEEPKEIQDIDKFNTRLAKSRLDFVQECDAIARLPGDMELKYNLMAKEVDKFLNKFDVRRKNITETSFNFWSALLYAFTVHTTIGYGNAVPRTPLGKVTTVLYMLLGVPLAVFTFIRLGDTVARSFRSIWASVRSALYSWHLAREEVARRKASRRKSTSIRRKAPRTQPRHRPSPTPDDEVMLHFPVVGVVLLLVVWALGAAALFDDWQKNWTFGNSLYFVLTSVTTVGLGDYYPTLCLPVSICLLALGIILISALLWVVQMKLESVGKFVRNDIDCQYRTYCITSEAIGSDSGQELKSPFADPTNAKAVNAAVGRIIGQMPLGARLLQSCCLSQKRRDDLNAYYRKWASQKGQTCQTDDYLLASLRFKLLQPDIRSHDDVNSLIGLCDYGFKSAPHNNYPEYDVITESIVDEN